MGPPLPLAPAPPPTTASASYAVRPTERARPAFPHAREPANGNSHVRRAGPSIAGRPREVRAHTRRAVLTRAASWQCADAARFVNLEGKPVCGGWRRRRPNTFALFSPTRSKSREVSRAQPGARRAEALRNFQTSSAACCESTVAVSAAAPSPAKFIDIELYWILLLLFGGGGGAFSFRFAFGIAFAFSFSFAVTTT